MLKTSKIFQLSLFLIIFSSNIQCQEETSNKKKEITVNKNLIELNGPNFDLNVISNKNIKWFIIFFTANCPYCHHCVKLLNDKIIDHYESSSNIKFGVVNLDHQQNVWLGVRFNITRIPYIIFIENNLMYQFNQQFDERVVYKFIDEEKNFEDSSPVPEETTVIKKASLIYEELTERVRIFFQEKFDKYGIKIRWNNGMTICLFLFNLGIIMILENKVIKFLKGLCFKEKKEETINDTNGQENKEEKDKEKEGDDKTKEEESTKKDDNKKVKKD